MYFVTANPTGLIKEIDKQVEADLTQIPKAFITIIIFAIIYQIITKLLRHVLKNVKIQDGIKKLIIRSVKILLVFIIFMVVASELGINTNSILAIFSLLGLAISLSVQNLISNLANAVSLLTNKPFEVGDYIAVAGVEGTVMDISFMYTKLVTVNEEYIYLTNSEVGTSTIINYTNHPIRRITQVLDLSYDNDSNKVKEVIKGIIDNEPLVLKDKEIYIAVSEYAESSIKYTVRVYCESKNFINCRDSLLEKYKPAFDNNNLSIPYKTITIKEA